MAIRSEDLYLSIPNASPLFSKLAISSQFKVSLDLVRRSQVGDNVGLLEHLTNCGLFNESRSSSQTYDFLCSSASLPGSNFNISEEMGSRQGMTERFASRRIYNEFDLTFYIDNDYNSLRMLEEWMNFINPIYNEDSGRYDGAGGSQLNAYQERNSYSRFRYPDDYRRKISITKFERDFLQNPNDRNNTFKNMPLLTYHFIDTFPVNINAVPMSYDGSTFLQVTAVFTYLRHTIEKHGNAQQSVREKLLNRQLGQVNPIKPRRFVKEVATTSSSVEPIAPVGYVSGKPYYGPFHEMMGVKMVGAEHTSEPHAIIYDTIGESLPDGSTTSSITRTVTEEEQQEQQQEQQQQQDDQQQQQQEDDNQQQQEQQDTTPPAAPTNLSIATGQADNTPTVTGNAEANSTVKLFSQSTLLGSTTTNAGGSFSVTVSSPLSDGTYTFTLTATDAANNVSNSSGITFIINTNAGGGNQGGGGYGYGS